MNQMTDSEKRMQAAMARFREGYNCAQSLLLAFEDILPIDGKTAAGMISPFGAGMGRLREVCGAFSASLLVLGTVHGYSNPDNGISKQSLYAAVQLLEERCSKRNGSIICSALLGLPPGKQPPVPEKRTEDYYRTRPCEQIIGQTAFLLAELLAEMEKE